MAAVVDESAAKSGEEILRLSPKEGNLIWLQSTSSKEDGLACAHCGCPAVHSLAWQLARIAGIKQFEDDAHVLDKAAAETFGAIGGDTVACSLGCGGLYCSEGCRAQDFEQGGHRFLCLGLAETEEHELYQLRLVAFASGYADELGLAQKLLGRVLADALEGRTEILDLVTKRGKRWEAFENESAKEMRSVVDETWALLQDAVPVLGQVPAVTERIWSKMIGFAVRQRLEMHSIRTLLLELAETLKTRSPMEQLHLGNYFLNAMQARRMQLCVDDDLDQEEEDEEGVALANSDDEDDEDDEEEEPPLSLPKFIAEPSIYMPCLGGLALPVAGGEAPFLQHSCVPSVEVKWTCSKDSGLEARLVKEWLLAPPDTLCYVERCLDLEHRHEELVERGIHCACARCALEASGDVPAAAAEVDLEVLRVRFRQAEHDEQYEEALLIADAILARCPLDVATLYLKTRILSWMDRWTEAHAMRLDALARLTDDAQGSLEAASEAAMLQLRHAVKIHDLFKSNEDLTMDASEIGARFERVALTKEASTAADEVWVSRPGQPVMAKDVCGRVIEEAESYAAARGGWTSSRHYAVPTTDLEVCNLEYTSGVLAQAFAKTIYPALAAQFGVRSSAIRTIDAFLVKYDAGERCYLPVHSDESEFSITLALNEPSEYEGGGTWFPGLGKSLNAEAGGMVSFPGSEVHGGKSITRGQRYIIAAFLYASEESSPQ